MPHFILKYLFDCFTWKEIGCLPYGMILTPFFQKEKIKLNEELHVYASHTITMITIPNLHKMQL